MENPTVIHYVKPDEIYGIYGSITLIFLILLIWYFVRSNLFIEPNQKNNIEGMFPFEHSSVLSHLPEWNGSMEMIPRKSSSKPTNNNYCGKYGGVSVCMYDVNDAIYKPMWDHRDTIYLPNSRTLHKQALEDSIVWAKI